METYAGAYAYQGGESAFVEGQGTFVLPNLGRGVKGAGVLRRRLETDFHYIERLSWGALESIYTNTNPRS
jgi:hypothetical protein